MESKKPWQSKTVLVNVAAAIAAAFYPPVAEWIRTNPEAIATGFAVINLVLRLVTKNSIQITADEAPKA
jgi:uncharacterized membrane protein required for colicin V production